MRLTAAGIHAPSVSGELSFGQYIRLHLSLVYTRGSADLGKCAAR
jgi:hypothetical protein